MSDESDFEQISLGEFESEVVDERAGDQDDNDHAHTSSPSSQAIVKNNKDLAVPTPRVQVEIPPSLLAAAAANTNTNNHVAQSEVSSLASSFVNLTSALAVQSTRESSSPASPAPKFGSEQDADADEQTQDTRAQWSLVDDNTTKNQEWQELQSLASSVLSNFELLNIRGAPVLRCKKCRYDNLKQARWCGACGIPLVANPCPDIDHQIALNLKRKYEQEDLALLRQSEAERYTWSEQSLFQRTTILQQEISTFVDDIKKGMRNTDIMHGIACPIGADLCSLVSQFIKRADVCEDYIKLVYVFTNKEASGSILKRGFAESVKFSENTEVALSQRDSFAWKFRNTTNYSPLTLSTIHEADNNFVTTKIGFLAAVVDWKGVPCRSYKAPSGNATLTHMEGSGNILPLVCFDASMRKTDIIRRLVNGFSRILNDFFHSLPVDFGLDPSSATKKIKADNAENRNQPTDYLTDFGFETYSESCAGFSVGVEALSSPTKRSESDLCKLTTRQLANILTDEYGVPARKVDSMGRWDCVGEILDRERVKAGMDKSAAASDELSVSSSTIGAFNSLGLGTTSVVAGTSANGSSGLTEDALILPPCFASRRGSATLDTKTEPGNDDFYLQPDFWNKVASGELEDSKPAAVECAQAKPDAADFHSIAATSPETHHFECYDEKDVVFIDGFVFGDHHGSAQYELILNEHATRYGVLTDTSKRNEIVSLIVRLIRQDGKAVVNANEGGWKSMTDFELRLQVGKDLSAMNGCNDWDSKSM